MWFWLFAKIQIQINFYLAREEKQLHEYEESTWRPLGLVRVLRCLSLPCCRFGGSTAFLIHRKPNTTHETRSELKIYGKIYDLIEEENLLGISFLRLRPRFCSFHNESCKFETGSVQKSTETRENSSKMDRKWWTYRFGKVGLGLELGLKFQRVKERERERERERRRMVRGLEMPKGGDI